MQASIFDKNEQHHSVQRAKIPGGPGGFHLEGFTPKLKGLSLDIDLLMYILLFKIIKFLDYFT